MQAEGKEEILLFGGLSLKDDAEIQKLLVVTEQPHTAVDTRGSQRRKNNDDRRVFPRRAEPNTCTSPLTTVAGAAWYDPAQHHWIRWLYHSSLQPPSVPSSATHSAAMLIPEQAAVADRRGPFSSSKSARAQNSSEAHYFQRIRVPRRIQVSEDEAGHDSYPVKLLKDEDNLFVLDLPSLIIPSVATTPVSDSPCTSFTQHDTEDQGTSRFVVTPPFCFAKFSLDLQLCALQFTSTRIRIAAVFQASERLDEHENVNGSKVVSKGSSSSKFNQWILEMSANDAHPITVSSEIDKSWPSDDAAVDSRHEIMPGGILWSDHGGNSQELMVVTRQGVHCYKVSLRRNSMSKTRILTMGQINPASLPLLALDTLLAAYWWEPTWRCLVVGAYGREAFEASSSNAITLSTPLLLLQPYFFQSSSGLNAPNVPTDRKATLTFPRLELPPPNRLPMVVAGMSRQVIVSRSPSSSGETQNDGFIRPISTSDVILVSLYAMPYLVEWHVMPQMLRWTLHRLARGIGNTVAYSISVPLPQQAAISRDEPNSSTETLPRSVHVVDNVLVMVLPKHKVHVLVDVSEAGPPITSSVTQGCTGDDRADLSVIGPDVAMVESNGRLILCPIGLDLGSILQSLNTNRDKLSFLMQRNSKFAKRLALKFVQGLLTETSASDGDLAECAKLLAKFCLHGRNWHGYDRKQSVDLIWKCTLLPSHATLRPSLLNEWSLPSRKVSAERPHAQAIFLQCDLIRRVLLPVARVAVTQPRPCSAILHFLVTFGIALGCGGGRCLPLLAMDMLTLSLLWQDPCCEHQAVAFLRLTISRHVVSDQSPLTRSEASAFASAILAFIENGTQSGRNVAILEQMCELSERLLSSHPCVLFPFLLERGKLVSAMFLYDSIAASSHDGLGLASTFMPSGTGKTWALPLDTSHAKVAAQILRMRCVVSSPCFLHVAWRGSLSWRANRDSVVLSWLLSWVKGAAMWDDSSSFCKNHLRSWRQTHQPDREILHAKRHAWLYLSTVYHLDSVVGSSTITCPRQTRYFSPRNSTLPFVYKISHGKNLEAPLDDLFVT